VNTHSSAIVSTVADLSRKRLAAGLAAGLGVILAVSLALSAGAGTVRADGPPADVVKAQNALTSLGDADNTALQMAFLARTEAENAQREAQAALRQANACDPGFNDSMARFNFEDRNATHSLDTLDTTNYTIVNALQTNAQDAINSISEGGYGYLQNTLDSYTGYERREIDQVRQQAVDTLKQAEQTANQAQEVWNQKCSPVIPAGVLKNVLTPIGDQPLPVSPPITVPTPGDGAGSNRQAHPLPDGSGGTSPDNPVRTVTPTIGDQPLAVPPTITIPTPSDGSNRQAHPLPDGSGGNSPDNPVRTVTPTIGNQPLAVPLTITIPTPNDGSNRQAHPAPDGSEGNTPDNPVRTVTPTLPVIPLTPEGTGYRPSINSGGNTVTTNTTVGPVSIGFGR
jgi:hypothetical protein